MLGLFFGAFIFGQAYSGWLESSDDRAWHGQAAEGFRDYLTSSHFAEATTENWESEFLQMGVFVLFTIPLPKGFARIEARRCAAFGNWQVKASLRAPAGRGF